MNIEKRNNIQLESIIANFDEETITYNECTLALVQCSKPQNQSFGDN